MSRAKAGAAARRIWLFGHFAQTNFGNESTLQAFLCNMRQRVADISIGCICTGPEPTSCAYGIPAIPVSRPMLAGWIPQSRVGQVVRSILLGIPCEIVRWLEGLALLKPGDALIVPGTGLVSDAYGLRGWGPWNLFKWTVTARLRGCKVLFVSVGAGPLYGRLGRFLATSALRLADFRSYRDVSSLDYLRSIGFSHSGDEVVPDLAFSLPAGRLVRTRGSATKGRNSRRIVGLGVMLYAGRYSVEHPVERTVTNYLDTLATIVEWLLARDFDVRLLIGDLCDRPVVQEFRQLLKERLPGWDESRILDDEVTSVDELLAQIAETDLVIATRFHNVLLALLCDKPVVAISFHHKVSSLMKATGLSDYCLEIEGLTADSLKAKVREAEENRHFLKAIIRAQAERWRAELDVHYDAVMNIIGFVPSRAASNPADALAAAGSH